MCYSARVKPAQHDFYQCLEATIDSDAHREFQNLIALEKKIGLDEIRKLMGLTQEPTSSQFKGPDEDERVYPNCFAPVIIWQDGQRKFVPMRYRIRPSGTPSETPNEHKMFSTRIEELEKEQTWKKLFGRKHALFPFLSYYEWVNKEGKRTQINFTPEERQIMWAPVIYDEWSSDNDEITFKSFAMITDEPAPEVAKTGHDRSPVFMNEVLIDSWLQPERCSRTELYEILNTREPVHYSHRWIDMV